MLKLADCCDTVQPSQMLRGKWTGTAGLCLRGIGMERLVQKADCHFTRQPDPPLLSASPGPPSWQPQPASAGTAPYCMRSCCRHKHLRPPRQQQLSSQDDQALTAFLSPSQPGEDKTAYLRKSNKQDSTELPVPPLRQPKEDGAASWRPCTPALIRKISFLLRRQAPPTYMSCASRTPGSHPSQPEHEPHFRL